MIKLNEYGNIICSRENGEVVREKILKEIKNGNIVVINFEGVEMINHSFADEAFGKLLYDLSEDVLRNQIKFVNANDDIKGMIKMALMERHKLILLEMQN
ncbi:uncharacterized protein DUF4325 [Caldicellulosiruptor bescii]|uniref:DUF4325 domain-containing protein n=2 Tax=Caldicellulosiruptor bescii TaxID=31899 RepID=B9MPY8_CALBD|nr:STAS-like domain-containing protein [Caldicellulosiruptor bescii]ACM61771.1 conserved hypothetical protein [Caldicellulosiruptor bescii DSM 6725]PBC88429.1 uncharacterized protein DUF4325 [Caldicellulosiruptor bescii]PBC92090.1 uncharacterized protein DUF4325 [Caldicellulosiruptor bescii]PBD05100.1 uncharacterized protein DUF4325 [Caldicellulosiruptor bescii]PBD05269.1 uncharacterized protein DUF4325 [Caldicellulosiruptor bescii]